MGKNVIRNKGNLKKAQKKNLPEKDRGRNNKMNIRNYLTTFLFAIIACTAAYLLYSHTISYGLVNSDDNIFIQDYAEFNNSMSNIPKSFGSVFGTEYYRPILNITFITDAAMGGVEPWVYHRTNVFLHMIAVLSISLAFKVMKYDSLYALLFALIYAVHPVLTPAASWISGRNDSLLAIFIMLSFISFIKLKEVKDTLDKIFWIILHLFFFGLSLFTKESAIALPLILILYVRLAEKGKLLEKWNIISAFGWFGFGIIWFFLRANALKQVSNTSEFGLGAFIKNLPAFFALTGKLFLPLNLFPLSNVEQSDIIAGIIGLVVISVLLFLFRKKADKRYIWLGLAWFVLFMLPSLFVRIAYTDDFFDYAEHRLYVPMFGLFIVIIELLRTGKIKLQTPQFIIPVAIVIALLTIKAYSYSEIFKNPNTYWTASVKAHPGMARGYLNLAKVYMQDDKLDSAEALYKKGMMINPKNKHFYIDLGVIYLKRNDFMTSAEYSKKAVMLEPYDPIANHNLGKAYAFLKNWSDAEKSYLKAINSSMVLPDWYNDLGEVYFMTGRYEKALEACQKALDKDPNNAFASSNIGSAYKLLGEKEKAEEMWQKAISLDPNFLDAYKNLVNYYSNEKKFDKMKFYANEFHKRGGKFNPEFEKFLAGI